MACDIKSLSRPDVSSSCKNAVRRDDKNSAIHFLIALTPSGRDTF